MAVRGAANTKGTVSGKKLFKKEAGDQKYSSRGRQQHSCSEEQSIFRGSRSDGSQCREEEGRDTVGYYRQGSKKNTS